MNRRSFLKKSTAVAGVAISQEILRPLAQAEAYSGPAVPPPAGRALQAELSTAQGDALLREDFSGFPAGWLSQPVGQLNGAIQEYHYFAHRGVPTGPWANVICHMDAWVVGDEDGKPYLEQHTVNDLAALTNPILVTGDIQWSDYSVEVKVKLLSLAGTINKYY
jgi:hypothetical protein